MGPQCYPGAKRLARRLLLAAALSAQIKVNVNLVRVLATVKNPAGELVGALNKEDFEILDNGVPQQIAVFERQTEQPLSVAMMVDASGIYRQRSEIRGRFGGAFLPRVVCGGQSQRRRGALQFQLPGNAAQFLHP